MNDSLRIKKLEEISSLLDTAPSNNNLEEDTMFTEKAESIMQQMTSGDADKPVIFLTSTRFKEMVEDGDLVPGEMYDELDDDAKGMYEAVDVMEEGTSKGYGMHWRRRSPLEGAAMRKQAGVKAEDFDMDEDMFDTVEEAAQRATVLGCAGTHSADDKFMPCASHDEWMKLVRAAKPEMDEGAEAMPAGGEMPAAEGMMTPGKSADSFLCGFQRKMVTKACEFCKGGCKSEDGLPGLGDVESQVKTSFEGSTVVGSGYSTEDDLFVIDLKRADGSCIEVFVSGDGDELGWLRIDENAVSGKTGAPVDIISKFDAEEAAVKSLDTMGVTDTNVLSVMVDIFGNEDVYVVEVDSAEKSYDVFVDIKGKVLGFDEYDYDKPTELSEEDEIKALSAELEIKRMYSREQRQAMAESGEAMPDGSFPIGDQADLENAIQAHGRASDIEAAKAHIKKRAKELGLENMIPAEWSEEAPMPEGEEMEKSAEGSLLDDIAEFRKLMGDNSI